MSLSALPESGQKNNNESNTENLNYTQTPLKYPEMSKMILMSATVTREPQTNKTSNTQIDHLSNYRVHFSKRQTPYPKSRKKRIQEHGLMTKSCEVLLECLKPFKKVFVARKTQITQSYKITRSILKTHEITYKKKATRKIQFFDFFEETQHPQIFTDDLPQNNTSPDNNITEDELDESEPVDYSPKTPSTEEKFEKIVSSEDFINCIHLDLN